MRTSYADPLSWAIGEFREELLRWIDTELVRLREREQAENRLMEEGRAAASWIAIRRFAAAVSGSSPGRRDLQLGLGWHESRTRERVVERDSGGRNRRPPRRRFLKLRDGSRTAGRPSDPRQRLDALARLLDDRLKQAQGAAGTWSGAGKRTERRRERRYTLSHPDRRVADELWIRQSIRNRTGPPDPLENEHGHRRGLRESAGEIE